MTLKALNDKFQGRSLKNKSISTKLNVQYLKRISELNKWKQKLIELMY